MPVIGNLFKGKANKDNLDELLVFIAPRYYNVKYK